MNSSKFARAAVFDVLLAVCPHLWIKGGHALARDIAIAYLCFIAELVWIGAVLVPARDYERGYAVNAIYFVSTTATLGVLAWQREFIVAVLLSVPYLLTLVKREVGGAW